MDVRPSGFRGQPDCCRSATTGRRARHDGRSLRGAVAENGRGGVGDTQERRGVRAAGPRLSEGAVGLCPRGYTGQSGRHRNGVGGIGVRPRCRGQGGRRPWPNGRIHQGGAGREAALRLAARSSLQQGRSRCHGLPRPQRYPELLGLCRPLRPRGPHVRAERLVEPARAPVPRVGVVGEVLGS